MSYLRKASAFLKQLKKPVGLTRFIAHNQRVFGPAKSRGDKKPVVLFELNTMHSAHIAYSYLAAAIVGNADVEIKAYFQKAYTGLMRRGLFKIRQWFGVNEFGAYRSFGVNEFIEIRLDAAQKEKARALWNQVRAGLHTRLDVEALTVNGVWIGDLVYDTYLMTYKRPTIEPQSAEFGESLLASIEHFVFWDDYLNSHEVRAISVSHCVYVLAIPLRIGVTKSIPVFQVNATHVFRMNPHNLFAYNDFVFFRERFKALPADVRKLGLEEAKRRIARRFAGEVGVDMAYSTKSAYTGSKYPQLLKESPRTKILIATHCFFDSPHSYGNNLFPDFYEWLDFLGQVSNSSDYDWYIKTHPDYLPGTREVIEAFIAKYPKITWLPADASHHQIIAEGINVALTVYGTIGFEYAALGRPVINASLNNPHIAYGFNIHAQSVDDYKMKLLAMDGLDFHFSQEEVYEYYFMRYIYNTENLFFNNYDKTIAGLGGYSAQFSPAIYERWLDEWSVEKHQAIISALEAFIKSGDFRMDYTHFGREFGIESIEVSA